ncbi:GerAB/ArcD/ProY family transporter [Paenibacillus tianjinensis]|uniref:GerAB/ArcD/ProY family transporter n=1 Tax=Paenibacillus tianjinensis TaxID=2810347 RepID=A0ABX7L9J8_9BACL|nr:GerAB/ArcD/ProY family transporter [Paenibacillus tianjinensis]QSF44829.1 GerAB/ArcD/ProY family transporter [Paenibacillus tianjinensis]
MNSLINIINFVPRELMDARFRGAQTSILAAVVLGTVFVYLFTALMAKFPGKDVQEILTAAISRGVINPLIIIFAALWCAAGLITILSFIDITLRFISPDTGPYLVVLGFLVVVCFCARMDSLSLLYGLEVMLGISVPLILYTLIKAVTNPDFSWDAVLQIITYFPHAPDVKSMAAATFSFSGYINMAVFNRVLPKMRLKHRWILGVQGLAVLLLTFYVPIGYFGTVAVERHVYTWFSTADSIGINTFIIERMLFIFYFAYLNLSLTSVIIHWHVGKELLTGLFPSPKNPKSRAKKWRELAILGLFSAITLTLMRLDQYQLNILGIWFLLARWLGELLLIMLLFYCYTMLRRRKP